MNEETKAVTIPEIVTKPIPITTELTPILPVPVKQTFTNEFDIASLLPTAGGLEITDTEKDILFAPVKDENVEIRPDGLIYLPWMEYVERLKSAFGVSWAIIPQGMPKISDNLLIWGFYLVIRGKLMGFSIGEQEYYPNNYTMTYTDACEGAKSNALMRLCKGIGISLELWKPSFVKEWKSKYAESYWGKNKRGEPRQLWKKKGATNGTKTNADPSDIDYYETPPKSPAPSSNAPATEKQCEAIQKLTKQCHISDEELKALLIKDFKVEHTNILSKVQASDLIKFLIDLSAKMKQ